MRSVFLAYVAVFLGLSFWGQAQAANTETLKVDGGLEWTGYKVTIKDKHTGDIKLKSGSVKMKGQDIVGGEFVMDMTTLHTDDSERLKSHLRSADFFEVDKFPEARFVITSAKTLPHPGEGGVTHEITGNLTIKGQTHPITFKAKVLNRGKAVLATGEATIPDRTKFDIKYNSGKFFDVKKLGDKLIDDKIDVRLNLKASRN